MNEETKDEVVSVLELANVAEALQLPAATGDHGRGVRTQLRIALEQAIAEESKGLDLRKVSSQEIHDSDVAYLARVAYVSSYLRIIDLMLQPATTFAKRLAVAKVAQANINNAESTKLGVMQLGRNNVADDKLRAAIKELRESSRALVERRAEILNDKKELEAADRAAEETETGSP